MFIPNGFCNSTKFKLSLLSGAEELVRAIWSVVVWLGPAIEDREALNPTCLS